MNLDFDFRPSQARVPILIQSEAAECGLVCLAMISARYGYHADILTLRSRFQLSLKGMSVLELTRCADEMKLSARALRLDIDELQALRLPCVLHWSLNHFVVLTRVSRKSVVIHDPAVGMRRLDLAEFSKCFTGIAVEISPSSDFAKCKKVKNISPRLLMGRITGLYGAFATLISMAVLLELLAILGPALNQWVIDEGLGSGDLQLLTVITIGLALMLFVQAAISFARGWTLMYFATHLNLQWTSNIFVHLLRLPVSWFEKRHLGDIVSRFASAGAIQHTLSTSFIEAILDGLLAIATLVMMLNYSVKLTIVVAGALMCYAVLRTLLFQPLREANEEALILESREQTCFLETVRGIQAIKLYGRELDRRARWTNLLVEVTNRHVRTEKLLLWFSVVNTSVFTLQGLLVFRLGGEMIIGGAFSIGALFAFNAYASQFSTRVSSLVDRLAEFRMLGMHAGRLADIVLEKPEESDSIKISPVDLKPHLEMVDVGFRYAAGEPWVVRHLNLQIEPGDSVALVGASGCGKTTVVKLLLGLLKPTEGDIRYGGISIDRMSSREYRMLLAAVMQEDHLLEGSLSDNISFFDPLADQGRVVQCAQLASIDSDIAKMPMGYHTLVGDMGSALSGGQKQRILLARALYKNPQVLILDEATSHLDVGTERAVNSAISDLQMTRICIAHRPQTIAMCRRVIELNDGVVVRDVVVD